ncbi:MAG: YfcC family protein [Pseudotabrizicola sp.]|uniref:YfcC family protein n=1 Tax=Pseudotabrizicola sp. TaxID=2939647 RepID=UPI00272EF2AD|nr:YfcC family protein [Pseudotabrizicola sp.]MDP2079694.1 YfcC family protein [Pseudotabrizicola sp.]MDZ7574229.1 YfcC family protein [Pseudotabrizicola sp.]
MPATEKPGFRFPSAFTILFALIMFVAALTWIIPAGKYQRVPSEALGKDVPLAGSYAPTEANPQGFFDVILAPVAGFYDPVEYTANAIDVSLFVLIIGGFIGVVTASGAIDAGIARAMVRLKGRETWMIPFLMALFALGGTTYGMAEETLAFYVLLIPVMIAAKFDALTAVAVILLGAGVGVLGSTINAFSTVIASDAAGVTFADGLVLRLIILVLCWVVTVAFVMRYAARVRADPTKSLVYDKKAANEAHFLKETPAEAATFTGLHKIVLILFALTFGVMIWGVSIGGWWMAEMSGLFLIAAIVIGIVARLGEGKLVASFVNGARDLLGVALIIGLARGIVVVMDAGHITDTILHSAEVGVAGLPRTAFILVVYWIEVGLSFFVPSTSGLAVLSMPILAPVADFAGVKRELVVTAFATASGMVNLITPTSAVVMGGLAIGRVPYERWLRFIWPLLAVLTLIIMAALALAVTFGAPA